MDFIVGRYVVIWAHILSRDINQRLSDIDQAYVCMRLISLDMGPYNHILTIQSYIDHTMKSKIGLLHT